MRRQADEVVGRFCGKWTIRHEHRSDQPAKQLCFIKLSLQDATSLRGSEHRLPPVLTSRQAASLLSGAASSWASSCRQSRGTCTDTGSPSSAAEQ